MACVPRPWGEEDTEEMPSRVAAVAGRALSPALCVSHGCLPSPAQPCPGFGDAGQVRRELSLPRSTQTSYFLNPSLQVARLKLTC